MWGSEDFGIVGCAGAELAYYDVKVGVWFSIWRSLIFSERKSFLS